MVETNNPRAAAAVVIGVGTYLHGARIAPLRYAARDAKALRRMLVNPAVCKFPGDHVALLTQERARHDRVVHYLSHWLPARAKGADLALIYFAGHGLVQTVGRREEGYLLPYDADPEDVVTRGVAMSDVGRWIDAIDAAAVIVCLDCCHAGKVILRDPTPAASRDLELRPAVLAAISGKGRFLIASCDEGQKSLEAEELGHGLFTYHLLKGLAGAGDRDRDGQVGVAELFTYVSTAVAQDARTRFGREQRPWTSATFAGDVFISCPQTSVDPSPSVAKDVVPGPTEDRQHIDELMAGADQAELIQTLRRWRGKPDPAATPAIFRCLAHPSEPVRRQAKKALHAVGWDRASAAIEELARCGQGEPMLAVLDGLEAFEAHPEVVGLLDRLAALLRGEHRNRAILLLERKRLGVDLDKVATLFRELQSPYRIEKALGQGLFTAAYLAHIEAANLPVVVQVLRPELAQQPQVRAAFLDLANQSMHFIHHNLVLTREVRAFPDRHVYYAVRDYVNGVTLQKLLESGRQFTPPQVFKIVRQLLAALTPLHERGLRHGGIKPANVFIREGDRVILGDPSVPLRGLGLALDRLSYDYRYAPPETFRGDGVVGPPGDFYALGCVVYELACGKPPYSSDNYLELAARHGREPIPPPATRGSRLGEMGDRFLLRLLAADAADRFGSLEEAQGALDGVEQIFRTQLPPAAAAARPLVHDQSLADYRLAQSMVSFGVSESSLSVAGAGVESTPEASSPLPEPSSMSGEPPTQEFDLPPESRVEVPEGPGAEPRSDRLAPAPTPGHLEQQMEPIGKQRSHSLAPPPISMRLGRYELLELIGSGGMGRVYEALDPNLRRKVAIKLVLQIISDHPEQALTRFRMEAEAAARLQHPNIVPIYDIGVHAGQPFYVMGLIQGGSLSQKLREGAFAPREAAALMEKIARAVQHAHEQRVLHRDLKPANILLDEKGEPHITDFGLAKLQAEPAVGQTQVGMVLGTPAYMSPEQACGRAAEVGPATDIWSLGAILYELLTGRTPFAGGSMTELLFAVVSAEPPRPRSLRADLDRSLEAICLKCLRKDPAQRYPTAGALADDLAKWLRGEFAPARSASLWKKLLAPFQRRKS